MSETQNEDAVRKERARRVAALAGASRQPGERARIGTRIAGSVAVLALVAAATLGVGAWQSYRDESAQKEARAEKLREEKMAEARKRITPSPSPSKKKPRTKEVSEKAQQPLPKMPVQSPTQKAGKPKEKKKTASDSKMTMSTASYSNVVLFNRQTYMCADPPGRDGNPGGIHLNQNPCDTTDADNQRWNIEAFHPKNGPAVKGRVTISNTKDGTCFDLPSYGAAPSGTHVSTAGCTDNKDDNEQWELEKTSDGSKRIHNPLSGDLCLQVGGDAGRSSPLIIGDCDAPTARWFLTEK